MNPRDCERELGELMQAHVSRIREANEYLAEIRLAIAGGDPAQLQDRLAAPGVSFDEIERLEQRRHRLLTAAGFALDRDGFEKCIAWCDGGSGELAALYRRLIGGLEELQRSIQVNTLLVDKGKQRLRRSIGVLTGVGENGNCRTYGSNGRAQDPAGRRDIAIA